MACNPCRVSAYHENVVTVWRVRRAARRRTRSGAVPAARPASPARRRAAVRAHELPPTSCRDRRWLVEGGESRRDREHPVLLEPSRRHRGIVLMVIEEPPQPRVAPGEVVPRHLDRFDRVRVTAFHREIEGGRQVGEPGELQFPEQGARLTEDLGDAGRLVPGQPAVTAAFQPYEHVADHGGPAVLGLPCGGHAGNARQPAPAGAACVGRVFGSARGRIRRPTVAGCAGGRSSLRWCPCTPSDGSCDVGTRPTTSSGRGGWRSASRSARSPPRSPS